ncbi:predicted protein [Histoplasma capsulatum var. duboisii H88]|uniref:Predicted protein n=1 Tax=Ajellomyces capsulatus (strain H88) TaxID=544711 RepID=F0UD37_AJEC8|nr:predicted protein [Histoplasma capsulatum var. duboisii H88]
MALYDKIPHSLRDPENFPPLTLCSRLHSVLPLALKVEVSNNSKTPWGRKPVLRAFAFSMTTMLIIYRDPGISVRGTVKPGLSHCRRKLEAWSPQVLETGFWILKVSRIKQMDSNSSNDDESKKVDGPEGN